MTDTIVNGKVLMVVLHLDWNAAPEGLLRRATTDGDPNVVTELYNMGLYKKVATALATDLEAAYGLTQNVGDESWAQNPGIGPYEENPRHTSVGDIIVLDNTPFVVRSNFSYDPLPLVLHLDHRTN